MTLVLALLFLHKYMSILLPLLLPLFGLRSRVKPSLRYLHWSVRTRRSLRYAMSVMLTLVLLHKWITIVLPPFYPFWVAVRGKKPHLKCLHWSFHIRRTLWHCCLAFALSYKLISILLLIFCIARFWVAVRGKAFLTIACIGHSVLGEPQGTILYCFSPWPFLHK